MDTQDYRQALTDDLHSRGLPGPGEVSVDWQLTSSLYEVHLPATGWWVVTDCPATLNALSETMGGSVPATDAETRHRRQPGTDHPAGPSRPRVGTGGRLTAAEHRVPVQDRLREVLGMVEPPSG